MAYADVEDLDATRTTLLSAGATERTAPRKVAPEARVCVLADADGNPIGLRERLGIVLGRHGRSAGVPVATTSVSIVIAVGFP